MFPSWAVTELNCSWAEPLVGLNWCSVILSIFERCRAIGKHPLSFRWIQTKHHSCLFFTESFRNHISPETRNAHIIEQPRDGSCLYHALSCGLGLLIRSCGWSRREMNGTVFLLICLFVWPRYLVGLFVTSLNLFVWHRRMKRYVALLYFAWLLYHSVYLRPPWCSGLLFWVKQDMQEKQDSQTVLASCVGGPDFWWEVSGSWRQNKRVRLCQGRSLATYLRENPNQVATNTLTLEDWRWWC